MKIDNFLLADAVSTQPDGKFNVLGGGITRLNVLGLPSIVPLGLLVRFVLDDDEAVAPHRIQIHIIDPDGVDVLKDGPELWTQAPPEPPQYAEGEQRFLVLAINMGGVPIQKFGLHRFGIDVDGESVWSFALPAVPAGLQQPGQVVPLVPEP
jgi:hypothetical protein